MFRSYQRHFNHPCTVTQLINVIHPLTRFLLIFWFIQFVFFGLIASKVSLCHPRVLQLVFFVSNAFFYSPPVKKVLRNYRFSKIYLWRFIDIPLGTHRTIEIYVNELLFEKCSL